MNDQDRYDYEVTRQLYEEEQAWLKELESINEWHLFLELVNGKQRTDSGIHQGAR